MNLSYHKDGSDMLLLQAPLGLPSHLADEQGGPAGTRHAVNKRDKSALCSSFKHVQGRDKQKSHQAVNAMEKNTPG